MSMLIFGLSAIAALFIVWTFFQLSCQRVMKPGWMNDVYFWLVTGSFWCGLGLLWFFLVRTWQAMTLTSLTFVQSPTTALAATTIIFFGLSMKVRAIALSNKFAGWLFIASSLFWSVLSIFWQMR